MKNIQYFLFMGFSIGLMTCKSSKKVESKKETDTVATVEKEQSKVNAFDCSLLADKEFVYEIAKNVIDNHDNKNIWNLSEVGIENFFTVEDYFTNASTKDRLVLMDGSAGGSAGTANNLLMLLSCTADTFNVVWAEQVGDFEEKDIKDLNNDGIKEIICRTSMMWMGECSDSYTIFNFKGGGKNILYTTQSFSVIDCGKDDLNESNKKGDTLECTFDCRPVMSGKEKYGIQQIRTTKVHNGGSSHNEILRNLKVTVDTASVILK